MASVAQAAARLRKWDPLLDDERSEQLAELGTRASEGGVVWKWDPLHRARIGTPYVVEHALAIWRRIACPTLLVGGIKSRMMLPDLEERLSAFEHGRKVLIDAGHNIHLHAPEALAAALRSFLPA